MKDEPLDVQAWLREASARCAAATSGPWMIEEDGEGYGIYAAWDGADLERGVFDKPVGLAYDIRDECHANALFIAYAHTDLPRALDIIRQQQKEIARLLRGEKQA